MGTKAQDALAIIELYKLRSEPMMRTARAWFVSEFSHGVEGRLWN